MTGDKKTHVPGVTIETGTVGLSIATQPAVVRQRYNRAQQLHSGARFFASELSGLESRYKDAPYGPHADRATWLFTASLLSAVSCLEASYNEAVEDVEADREVFDSVDRLPILDKYNLLLKFHRLEGIRRDRDPVQSVALAIKLRNAIAHFRPEWGDDAKTSVKLEKALGGMDSPLMPTNHPFFPTRCASAERAHWAAKAVFEFVSQTRESLGLRFGWKS